MKKVLILTQDALFRAKLHRKLLQGGAATVWASDPSRVGTFLDSGEIGLLIADMSGTALPEDRFSGEWARPGLKIILTGTDRPEGARAPGEALEGSASAPRVVGKEHLAALMTEILAEVAPELIPGVPGTHTEFFPDRRESGRVEKSLRIFLDCPGGHRPGLKSRTVDISSSGARVVTRVPLSPEARCRMRIVLPFFSETISVTARVIWSRDSGDRNNVVSGLFFDQLSDTDRFNLTDYLAKDFV